MAKYSPRAGKDVEEAMHEMKEGKLKMGRSGKKVTSRKQAIAIGLSEARKEGAKVPDRRPGKKAAAGKKVVAGKKVAAGEKVAAKKVGPKKSTYKDYKKARSKKNTPDKAESRKPAPKKFSPRKASSKKVYSKRAATKKTAPRKTAKKSMGRRWR